MRPSPDATPGAPLVRALRKRGIRDARVLDAIARIPRARFLPPDLRDQANEDVAVEIGSGQTISQPFLVAVMTLQLSLTGTERVLEVGTGSGYQTAVLARLAAEVHTVERLTTFSLRARSLLDGLALTNIRYRVGDGTLGWPGAGPFDRILITAGAPMIPPTLFDGLSEGGLMVLPLGGATSQNLTLVRKRNGQPSIQPGLPCRFVPLIGAEGWDESQT